MIGNKKVLLVMGGFAQVCDIVESAKRRGIHVIVTDYLEDSPAKRIADESYMISITDVDAIVELCKERGVDGVMNYCIDPGQKPYQKICEKLDLPCYGSKEQFEIMTNKDLFKQSCIENGLDVIPEYHPEPPYHDPDGLDDISFPVVVKPSDGRASKGITICESRSDLADAIERALTFSKRKKVTIERHISGQEVVVKYFVCDGHIVLTSMADLFTCFNSDGSRAYIWSQVFPSKHYRLFKKTTDNKVRAMIRNLGIRNGALSFDGFFDGNSFRFFDPSFRMGGAQDWRIVAHITGVNISDMLTNFALTGHMGDCSALISIDHKFADKSAAMLYFLAREGVIGSILGIDRVAKLKSVIGYHLSHVEGDQIKQSGTSDHVVARFLLVCDNHEQLKNEIVTIQNHVKILDENGDDMLLPNFNVELI